MNNEPISFYCVKCKKQHEVAEYEFATTKNGRRMAVAKCHECGTKITKFVKKED